MTNNLIGKYLLFYFLLQVQLQHKIKQEAERFRQLKASHEKELLQVQNSNLLYTYSLILYCVTATYKHMSSAGFEIV